MIGSELIMYSLKNLWQRKSRAALTIFSILLGITTIFLFISFGLGLFSYIEEFTTSSSVDKLIVQAKTNSAPGVDDTFALDEDDLKVVSQTPGVFEAAGLIFKTAEVDQKGTKKFTFMMGYDPQQEIVIELMGVDIIRGRELRNNDHGKVVLGYSYLVDDKLFPRAYDLNDNIDINGEKFTIIGFVDSLGNPQDDSNIYMTEETIRDLHPDEELTYGWVIAQVDIDDLDQTAERIEKNLRQHRDLEEGKEDFYVQSFEDLLDSYSSVLNIIIGFIILIALISVIVSAVNTANTMITSVLERTREIGVMKAIGAKNSEVFSIFFLESAFLGFVAGTLGVLLGWILAASLGAVLNSLGWGFLAPKFTFTLFAGCIAFATITGALSGVFPAANASKTNIVEALRYE